MSTNAIWVAGIAAVLVGSPGIARADDNDSSSNTSQAEKSGQDGTNAAQKPVRKTKTTTTTTTTKVKAKKKAKGTATGDTAADKADRSDKGDRSEKSESAADKASGTVGKVNRDADKAATSANEGVVGAETQQSNQEKARDPRLRRNEDRDAKKAAEAVGKTTTTAAEGVANVVADTTRATDQPGPYEPFALGVNPLGLIVGGRYSIQAEWAPVTHHVVLVSPHFIHTSVDIATSPSTMDSQTFTGVGGEVGYRYYTGHRGMNGVFIGPSIIVGAYNASLLGGDQAFTDIGGAVDVGFKGLVADHLALGGGVGIEYLHVSHDFGDLPTAPAAIAASGVKPRLIFEAGYAF
jgi:hypothetical protein